MNAPAPNRHPKVACIQWRMKEVSRLDDLLDQLQTHVRQQAAYGCDVVVFPELFSLGLLDTSLPATQAIHQLAQYSAAIVEKCVQLARREHINILAGSLPTLKQDRLYNVATFCHRDGRPPHTQDKLHPTPYEKQQWAMQGGDTLQGFDTDIGRCGILICYDVEFPELARLLNEQGMDILLVPFWTDGVNAYHRVRYCAQARAIENECYVAMAGSTGVVPGNAVMDYQYAQSAILSPSDLPFPEEAILAAATTNEETFVIAELELEKLTQLRQSGSVRIGQDRRRDLYHITWRGKNPLQVLSLHGKAIVPHLKEIAQLRIEVFREFPYLYEGSLEYELNYLQTYVNSARSLIVLIRDGERAIGATTALPLQDADTAFHAPFIQHGIQHNIALQEVYYFGESVLLPEYRGQSLGHRFFDAREQYARQLGYPVTAFCAVVRDKHHPLRPNNYLSHDSFWKKRGYQPLEGFTCGYHWKDIDQVESSDKLMQFWIKKN